MDLKTIQGAVREILPEVGHLEVVTAGVPTGNGDGGDSLISLGIAPWKRWKVVGLGFIATLAALHAVAEIVSFGLDTGDIGAAAPDCFGMYTLTADAESHLIAGDTVKYDVSDAIADADAVDEHATGAGGAWSFPGTTKFNVWQTKQGLLTVEKTNVANSDMLVVAYMVILVDDTLIIGA